MGDSHNEKVFLNLGQIGLCLLMAVIFAAIAIR
jgi:hypothetical protein